MKKILFSLFLILSSTSSFAEDVLAQVLSYGTAKHAGGLNITITARVLIVGAGTVTRKETDAELTLNLTTNQTTATAITNQVATQIKSLILAEYNHNVVRVLAPPLVSSTP